MPVRNEQAVLPRLLDSLRGQRGSTAFHACFFLDSCTDDSERVIRDSLAGAGFGWSIASSNGNAPSNAGKARAAALRMGLAQVGRERDARLLTTDADSAPAPDWVEVATRTLGEVEVAAGRIVRRGDAGHAQDRVEAYYDRLYRLRRRIDPVDWEREEGHHFTGGANLAFRADAYAALGGFPPLPCGEDAALIDAASRAGLRVRREPAMLVETSARRIGRAPGGLAADLSRLDRDGEIIVGHPDGVVWQYRAHAAARQAFARAAADAGLRATLGQRIALSGDHILGVARDCPNAEAFAMRIVPAAPFRERAVPLAQAERALDALERGRLECAA